MTDRIAELADYLQQPDISLTVLADGSGVILDIAASQVITLNNTGTTLAEAMRDGARELDELTRQLSEEYDVDAATADAEIQAFCDTLSGYLLTTRSKPEA